MEIRKTLTDEEWQNYLLIRDSYSVLNRYMNNNEKILEVPEDKQLDYIRGIGDAWVKVKAEEILFVKELQKTYNIPGKFTLTTEKEIFWEEEEENN